MKNFITFRQFLFETSLISEGKHWPADYVKTAVNAIKASDLGQQSWYSDNDIKNDVDKIVEKFEDLSHKSSNLGYFMPVVRMLIGYSGTSSQKKKEFVDAKARTSNYKIDNVIRWLKLVVNDPSLESKLKEKIKAGMSYEEFEKEMVPVEKADLAKANSIKFNFEDKGYDIMRIDSYQQLNAEFGGKWTGYRGKSEWCHANGTSTYETWTSDGTKNFFVIFKKNWKEIKAPKPADNAYDEYGLSLMAILIGVASKNLEKCTLRWNHIIEPS